MRLHAFLIFAFVSAFSFGQTVDTAKLSAYLTTLAENDKFMGSVALQVGDLSYSKAVGFADVAEGVEANAQTIYRIGSISKTFTTVMILKKVETGEIDLSATIEGYFPSVPQSDRITIAQLLAHRSGIHNFTNDEAYWTYYTQPQTREEMVQLIAEGGSDFTPDSRAEYSNSNFVLLTYIAEDVYGKSYSEILQEQIVVPLGLEDTRLGGPIQVEQNQALSYSFNGNWELEKQTDISVPLGAGGIVSTPSDLNRFAEGLFGGELISQESLDLMKLQNEGYGMGLFVFPFNGKRGFGHNGGIDGFSSTFAYFEEGDVTFSMISNGLNYNLNEIAIAALSAAYGEPFDIPVFNTFLVDEATLQQYVGSYSSDAMPLVITVTVNDGQLIAQASGQSAIPMTPTALHTFRFDMAKIELVFYPEEGRMILKQGGEYEFKRD